MLIELTIDVANNLSLSYLFTDVYIVTAIAEDIVHRHGHTRNAAMNVLNELEVGSSNDEVTLTKQMFVRAASPSHLLALMGFPSDIHPTKWRGLIKTYSNHRWGDGTSLMNFPNIDEMKPSILDMVSEASGQAAP